MAHTPEHNPIPGLFDFTKELDPSPLGLADVNQTVDTAFEAERKIGQRNLLESATGAAGRRGLERTDTPVFEPFLRASADLESRFGSAKAGAKLGFGERARNFQEEAFQGRQGLFQNNQQFFNNQAFDNEQFQERIKTQAFQNRLQLAKLGSDIGLGLANIRAGSGSKTIELSPSFSSLLDSLGSGFELLGGGIDAFF